MRKIEVYAVVGICLGLGLCGSLSAALAADGSGQALYEARCASCHGSKGDGQGPLASVFNPRPVDFKNPGFWQGNVNQKITQTVENGHGPMPALNLSSSQIKAVTDYMSHTFK